MINPNAKRMALVLTGAAVAWAGLFVLIVEVAQYVAT